MRDRSWRQRAAEWAATLLFTLSLALLLLSGVFWSDGGTVFRWSPRAALHPGNLLWLLVIAAILVRGHLWLCRRQHGQPGHCRKCGYNLTGNVSGRCPECGRSIADTTTPGPTSNLWVVSLVTLLAVAFIAPAFSCACGHLGRLALLFTGPMFVLAWWPFLFARESRFVPRALAMIAVITATMLLLKNVCDVLWLGHDPVF